MSTTVSIGSLCAGGTSPEAPRSQGTPSTSLSPARCAAVTSGNSSGVASISPAVAAAGRAQRGLPLAERDGRHGPLVDPVRADEPGDLRVREARVQPGGETGGVGHGQELSEHRAGVPVDVAVPAFAIAPSGAPRDTGDDDHRRLALGRRPHLDQGVVGRVVPVHPRRERGALRHRHVQLERETAARRPGRSEQPRAVRPRHRAHDPRRQVEHPRELREIRLGGGGVRGAREHGHRRGRGRGEVTREGQPGQRRPVSLVEPGQAAQVVHLDVRPYAGVVHGRRKHQVGVVGRIGAYQVPVREVSRCSVCVARSPHAVDRSARCPLRHAGQCSASPRSWMWYREDRDERRAGLPQMNGHDKHAGHSVGMFRDRFWFCTLLTVPILVWSETVQGWLGYGAPSFLLSDRIPAIFGTIVFVYGGLPFLKGGVREVRARQPGMMLLISLAIVVAFASSVASETRALDLEFWWELALLIDVMLLGHWQEMKAISQASGALEALAALLPDEANRGGRFPPDRV